MIDIIHKIFEAYDSENWTSSESNDEFSDAIYSNVSAVIIPHFYDIRYVEESKEMWYWVSSIEHNYYVETDYDEETDESDGYEESYYVFDDIIRNIEPQYGANPFDSLTGHLTQERYHSEICEKLFPNSYKSYLEKWIKKNIRRDQNNADIGWILSKRWKDEDAEEECDYPEEPWEVVKLIEIERNHNGHYLTDPEGGIIDMTILFEYNDLKKVSSIKDRGWDYELWVHPSDPKKCVIRSYGLNSYERKFQEFISFPVIYCLED